VFSQSFSSGVDGVSSVSDPNQVFLSNLDFFLKVFSVSGGFISGGFVGISNSSQIRDHVSMNLFVSFVNFIMFSLSINIGLFEGSQ
jgi:hypothetical protein